MLLSLVPGLAVNVSTHADGGPLRTPLGEKVLLISSLLMLLMPAVGLLTMLVRGRWSRWPGVVTVLLLLPAIGGCAVLAVFTNKEFILGDNLVHSEPSPDGLRAVHLYSGWGSCEASVTRGWELTKVPDVVSSVYCHSADGGTATVEWLEDGGIALHGDAAKPLFFGPH